MNTNISVGTAIVICMLLYLADKHRKLKLVLQLSGSIGVAVLLWAWLSPKYQEWRIDRYTKQHVEMKRQVIQKYGHIEESAFQSQISKMCVDSTFSKLTEGEKEEVVYAVTGDAVFAYHALREIPNCSLTSD
jgi:hypothetical protein